jgi:trimeric autotransporter adhesin
LTTAAQTASSAAQTAQEALTAANANKTSIADVKTTADKAAKDVADALTNAANAQKSADDAAKAATAAQETADKAVKAAAENAKNIATNTSDIAKIQNQLKSLGTNEQLEKTATNLNGRIDSLKNVLDAVKTDSLVSLKAKIDAYKGGINALYSAVTEVSLVGSFSTTYGKEDNAFGTDLDFDFATGKVLGVIFDKGKIKDNAKAGDKNAANWTFGVDDPDGQTVAGLVEDKSLYIHKATDGPAFTVGENLNATAELIIRVNPTNANLTKEMVRLENSNGDTLKDVKVVGVDRLNTVLTRATGNGALWKVSLQLDPKAEIDDNGYIAGVSVKKDNELKKVLYAVAVNNTADQAAGANREVFSSYDVTFGASKSYTAPTSLDAVKVYAEANPENFATLENALDYKDNFPYGLVDGKKIVGVENGAKFVVDFSDAALAGVKGFYVDLDRNFAGADKSDESEGRAWNNYTYTGIQQYVSLEEGNNKKEVSVTLPDGVKNGDNVAFRVFAVNEDGTYTKLNGDGFTVHVGAEEAKNTVSATMTVSSATPDENSVIVPVPASWNIKGTTLPTTLTTTTDNKESGQPAFTVGYYKDKDATTAVAANEAKYLKFTLTSDPAAWKDNSTATGHLKNTGLNGIALNDVTVNITKAIPTAADAKDLLGFSWKTNQLENDVYTAFMETTSWTTPANEGTKNFVKAWNFAKNADLSKVTLTIADVAKPFTGATDQMEVAVAKGYIDNKTEHASTLSYNFGKISSESKNEDGTIKDYAPTFAEFKTVFACPTDIAYNTVEAKKDTVTYSATGAIDLSKSKVKNSSRIESIVNGLNTLEAYATMYLVSPLTVTVTTDANGVQEYYEGTYSNGSISLSALSNSTVPTADVPSHVNVTGTDAFGHKVTFSIPLLIKKPVATAKRR